MSSAADMSDAEFAAELERIMTLALNNPMPSDLKEAVADQIEPYTINAHLKHGDVMDCINIAYPLIRDYIRGHEAGG